MKKINTFLTIIALLLPVLMLSACGKSEFGLTENTGKLMVITAKNGDNDSYFISGSLEVNEGEQIVISPNLKQGQIRVELIRTEEEQSIDKLPDMDGEPALAADISGTEEISETLPAGEYMLKATCLKKATGIIRIEVKPAE